MGLIGDLIEFIVKFPFVVIGWIIVGAIAGDLARRFTNSPDKGGISDFVLGIFGAIIGGLLAGLVGIGSPTGGIVLVLFNLVVATIGAAVIVMIWKTVTGNNRKAISD